MHPLDELSGVLPDETNSIRVAPALSRDGSKGKMSRWVRKTSQSKRQGPQPGSFNKW